MRQRKSLTVRPWDAPAHLAGHYWRGVLDGDGTVTRSKDGRGLVLLVGNRFVVNGFARFVEGLTGCRRKARRDRGKRVHGVRYARQAHVRAILGALYGGCSVALERKHLAAATLLAEAPRRGDWSGLTASTLERLRAEHGSWARVAAALGIPWGSLGPVRRRLGF